MMVAKVGGSLFDLPGLVPHLRQWLQSQPEAVWLVPGGGQMADTIRAWDATHSLGEALCHELALQTLHITANFLRSQVGDLCQVVDCHAVFQHDENLPRTWAVTSDSLALALAIQHRASKLVLLKSTDDDVQQAHRETSPIVDEHFSQLLKNYSGAVQVINFRAFIANTVDAHTPQP